MTTRDLIARAYRELGIVGGIDDVEPGLAQIALDSLNALLNRWNAERRAVYADRFDTFTLTSGLNPHTIGPSGATWTLTQRPVSIEHVDVLVGGVYLPVRLETREWWTNLALPTTTSNFPTRGYYDATWPNGSLYLYPVPTDANTVRLTHRIVLTALDYNDTFTMPPGYEDATVYSLEERLAMMPMFSSAANPELREAARKARALVFTANDQLPTLVTRDSGLPGGRGRTYHYLTGPFR